MSFWSNIKAVFKAKPLRTLNQFIGGPWVPEPGADDAIPDRDQLLRDQGIDPAWLDDVTTRIAKADAHLGGWAWSVNANTRSKDLIFIGDGLARPPAMPEVGTRVGIKPSMPNSFDAALAEVTTLRNSLAQAESDLDKAREKKNALKTELTSAKNEMTALDSANSILQDKVAGLLSNFGLKSAEAQTASADAASSKGIATIALIIGGAVLVWVLVRKYL